MEAARKAENSTEQPPVAAAKRAAPEQPVDEPEQKKPAAAPSTSCSWGGSSSACAWGSGSGCSWGSGGCSGFAAVASSGGGFGSAASAPSSAAPASSAFSGGAAATTFAVSPSPAVRLGESQTPSDEPPVPVEAATTGEEDETCVYRVRAKLFRLEVRLEQARQAFPTIVPEAGTLQPSSDAKADEDKTAVSPKVNSLPDVSAPAPAADTEDPPAVSAKEAAEATKATEPADVANGEEAEGDEEEEEEEDDDDAGAGSEATAKGEPAALESQDGPMVEVTRWVESGVGQLRLLVHKPLPKGTGGPLPFPRLVMRVELVHRLILNEPLLPSMAPAERVSDTSVRFVMVSAINGQPQSYLLRVKLPADADQLISKINATIPRADNQ